MTVPAGEDLAVLAGEALGRSGVAIDKVCGQTPVLSPVTGTPVAAVDYAAPGDVDAVVNQATRAFLAWRATPAPTRGALVGRLAELLRERWDDLATLVSLESGTIISQARQQVRAMIGSCEFAAGLSRRLSPEAPSPKALSPEALSPQAPGHAWHPLGVAAVITAFDSPLAVWSWHTAVALACGDPVIWKPSRATPLAALAVGALLDQAITELRAPRNLSQVLLGGADVGNAVADHPDVAIVSAAGSARMGQAVGAKVAARSGRALIETGGNHSAVVTPSADLDLAVRGIVHAVGTGGQPITARRVIAHRDVIDELSNWLADACQRLPVGNPLEAGTRVGPLIDDRAWKSMTDTLGAVRAQGGAVVTGGGRRLEQEAPDAYYAEPALVRMPVQTDIVREETSAPVLYVMPYSSLREAIEISNGAGPGGVSFLYTRDQAEARMFLSAEGSDSATIHVNTAPAGAGNGGAFGEETEPGGGPESDPDAWRSYLRRVRTTGGLSGQL
jgi:aldehyde dehydrogenase (NAD+)